MLSSISLDFIQKKKNFNHQIKEILPVKWNLKCSVLVHIWTEISAGTEISNLAGTEIPVSVPVQISAVTRTKPNFGRSLVITIMMEHRALQ